MGVAHFNLQTQVKSIKYFLKAVTHCPYNVEYRANLVGAYVANGDHVKASFSLEKGLKLVTDSVLLLKRVALTYIKMKRYRDAIKILQKTPKEKWGKNGLQEVFEKAQKGLLKSNGEVDERQQ